MRLLFIALALLLQMQVAFAGMILEATYPYSLEQQEVHTVYGDSTVPMYINLRSFDNLKAENAAIKIVFPSGFKPSANESWQVEKIGENYVGAIPDQSVKYLSDEFKEYVEAVLADRYHKEIKLDSVSTMRKKVLGKARIMGIICTEE